MKIDLHTHTKKCKSGDPATRAISPEKFCEIVLSTEVRIVAITNHNDFDHSQYEKIISRIGSDVQVWPGIELDILEDGMRGHLLVIVSPTRSNEFSKAIATLIAGKSPDDFVAEIDTVVSALDSLKPLYVAHYKQKKPNISDQALERLARKTNNPECIIKEVTNSISAGIYISHGHASIYGSDVHDWAKYADCAHELPDLRLPVDSFEQFCLLLKKDQATINTVLNKKTSEILELSAFDDASILAIKVFNDINIIFGPKGTGKSCMLRAIAKHYSESGIDAKVFESASDRLEEIFDIKGKDLSIDLNTFDIEYCTQEIEDLRSACEIDVTSVNNYKSFYIANTTNKNAKKLRLKDINPEGVSASKREFLALHKAAGEVEKFLKFLAEDQAVKRDLLGEESAELARILHILLKRLNERKWVAYSNWKEVCLLNSTIELFRIEVQRKTGTPALPTSTGFKNYALNRAKVEVGASKIIKGVETEIPIKVETLGSLGSGKGILEFRTEFKFQNGETTSSSLSSLTAVKKTTQKKFAKQIKKIYSHAYSEDLFQLLADLNEIEDVQDIKTVYELLLFNRYFALDGTPYTPSSGEASMVMLQRELDVDKDIYILDEPERSLGNEYISEVIVPLIKERARSGKKIFISTHDANIAVRTLPYSSVYRCHTAKGYCTYVGNPYSNNLVNIEDGTDRLDWKVVSMRTLEGGKEAFGERGKIYGND
ncbi:MAG: hypothetical protein HS116_25165 [Planctomycetes bacterium]|nr:hypothetical protein [Planctomycetota bacterium]